MAKEKLTRSQVVDLVIDRYNVSRNGVNSCEHTRDNINAYLNVAGAKLGHGARNDPQVVVNLLLVAVENIASLMSDTPVDVLVSARLPRYDLDAEIYQQVLSKGFEDNDIDTERRRHQKFMLFHGVAYWKLTQEEDRGTKKIKFESIDPTYIFIDPLAKRHQDIKYLTELHEFSKEELKKLYPKYNMGDDGAETEDDNDDIAGFNSAEQEEGKETITVYEHWCLEGDKEKYPNGRRIVCTDAQLLEDKPHEYSCGLNYVANPCYSLPDRIVGLDFIKDLKPLQEEISYLYKRVANIIKLISNGRIVLNGASGINKDKITNKDGEILEVKGAQDVRNAVNFVYPPTSGIGVFLELANKLEFLMNTISGIQDVMQGRGQITSNIPSGKSIEEMQQAAQNRLREMIRNYKSGISMLGEKYAQLVHQTGDVPQIVKLSGVEAEKVKAIMERERNEMIEDIKAAGGRTPEDYEIGADAYEEDRGIKLRGESGSDRYVQYTGDRLGDPLEFRIKVKAGTDLPKSKLDIAAEARLLFASGKIDLGTYLKLTDFPMREEILEKSPEWQAFQQFVQMQQEAAKNAPPRQPAPDQGAVQQPQPSQGEPLPETGGQP